MMQSELIYDCTPRFVHFAYLLTVKERDTESGLNYFGARYYGSNMGRFMSPDPSRLSVDFQDPQTWNRYTYVLNRPLTMIDRNGNGPSRFTTDQPPVDLPRGDRQHARRRLRRATACQYLSQDLNSS